MSTFTAGTSKSPSPQVADPEKVIENTQRDANIALTNQIALIFHRLGIDANDLTEPAVIKWNFLSFKPGLMAAHSGVDPHQLTRSAQSAGYYPFVLFSARRISDGMRKTRGVKSYKDDSQDRSARG